MFHQYQRKNISSFPLLSPLSSILTKSYQKSIFLQIKKKASSNDDTSLNYCKYCVFSNMTPHPSATQSNAFSATKTGTPNPSSKNLSKL